MKSLLKPFIFYILPLLILTSCYSTKAPEIRTGMSVDDFKKEAKHEELVNLDGRWSVYKVFYGYDAQNVRFYYFYDNKLVKMDGGRRAADYKIILSNQ